MCPLADYPARLPIMITAKEAMSASCHMRVELPTLNPLGATFEGDTVPLRWPRLFHDVVRVLDETSAASRSPMAFVEPGFFWSRVARSKATEASMRRAASR